jgi:hypothetical protein
VTGSAGHAQMDGTIALTVWIALAMPYVAKSSRNEMHKCAFRCAIKEKKH